MKTVDFSETIAACDLKVGRSRQLIEFMKVCDYLRSRSFLHLGPWSCTYKISNRIFSETTVPFQNQTLYESFQVQGNENLVTRCWSHDQDGRHAHIW